MPTNEPSSTIPPSADLRVEQLLLRPVDPEELAELYAEAVPLAGGRYLLGESLGAGGMGRVFKALDTLTQTEVAIKMLNESLLENGNFLARFRDEATLLEKCEHPHVVRYLENGEDGETGALYIVMELMAGTVQEWLNRPIPLARAVAWTRAAAQALRHAHALGVFHRDIKPSNLLLTAEGHLKVGDFGVALAATELKDESAQGACGTDLHDLGLVFYALCTGRIPRVNPLRPSQAAKIPKRCDVIFDRATTEQAGRQFPSAKSMDGALADLENELTHPPRYWPWAAALFFCCVGGTIWWTNAAPSGSQSLPAVASPGIVRLEELQPAATAETATKDHPYRVELGHNFLPVPECPGVLLDAMEVQRRQMQQFVDTLDEATKQELFPNIFALNGKEVARTKRSWITTCPNPEDAAGGIDFQAAEAYCRWLTERERAAGRLPEGAFFRLPFALEWFHAYGMNFKMLTTDPWPAKPNGSWGDDWPPPVEVGNFAGLETAEDPDRPKQWEILNRRDSWIQAAPSGCFSANANGFYDMDGNLSEWGKEAPTKSSFAEPARIVLGHSWESSTLAGNLDSIGYDYVTTGAAARGFRIALQLRPPKEPCLLLTLVGISDQSGEPNTDHPGQVRTKFTRGEQLRVTWRVENFGTAAAVSVHSNAFAGGDNAWKTVYRSPILPDKPAIGGGVTQTATLGGGQTVYFSFDMDTTSWPATACRVSAAINSAGDEGSTPHCIETSAPGAALPWRSHQWWIDVFSLTAAP